MFSEIIFLASVAGMSMMCGFGATLAVTKKKDPNMFTKVCSVPDCDANVIRAQGKTSMIT